MFETPTQTPISPVPPPVVRSKSSSRLGTGILALAALVAIGGVAFAAGRVTAPETTSTAASTTGRQGFGFTGGGAGTGNGAGTGFANRFGGENGGVTLRGTVTAISSSSLSLKLANGTTVTIPVDSSTTYHRQQAAANTDVTSGATVLVEVSGFGGRGAGAGGATGGANASPGAGGSFPAPSFDSNASPNPNRFSGQLSFGTARDITIAAQ